MSSSLKQARIESGKTLEEISDYLKIRKQYLEALEEGDLNSMPAEVYVKGYLKLYSNYLGIVLDTGEEDEKEPPKDIDFKNRAGSMVSDYKWKKQLIIISILTLIIIPIIFHLILPYE
ncbi:helix-turn-helix domain-containing protein [Candidatus Tisiphia endosymbiont of Mystacides longicornis]|uniref:helix-turn-helix domain-containing protein n=1 Tax=Candidatus Tisiphia endosymbiont of Mystacides longicornis TaxID=3139330 RepID=UPI003CCB69B5